MQYDVFLTPSAERDLEEIADFISEHDTPLKARHVVDRCQQVIEGLRSLSGRGSFPKELLSLGVRDFRQVLFKPYRLIYRVIAGKVFVMLIADGRRDLQAMLSRRLLRDLPRD